MHFKPEKKAHQLDPVIDELLKELNDYPGYSEDYAKRVEQLEKLYKLRDGKTPDPMSQDTLVVVGGNVLIALILIGFEQKHVITTKAISFFSKLR